MAQYMEMPLSFFLLSLAIRNVWPQRMGLKAFIVLYILLLLAGVPVTLLSCIPYGLFGILAAVCIFGLAAYRDTASQNVCMGMIGFVLAAVVEDLIPGQNGSVGRMIYNNALHILGYLLVMFFLLLAMRRSWREQIQAEAKKKALQDLQDYTYNLETMYNGLRSFKHDYINILLSISGYIENRDMEELKKYFEDKIFPTKNLIDQGDYKLNQLSNIGVLEIKSLLSAKMIYAHESGIDVTIDIPDRVDIRGLDFPMLRKSSVLMTMCYWKRQCDAVVSCSIWNLLPERGDIIC